MTQPANNNYDKIIKEITDKYNHHGPNMIFGTNIITEDQQRILTDNRQIYIDEFKDHYKRNPNLNLSTKQNKNEAEQNAINVVKAKIEREQSDAAVEIENELERRAKKWKKAETRHHSSDSTSVGGNKLKSFKRSIKRHLRKSKRSSKRRSKRSSKRSSSKKRKVTRKFRR